MLHCKHTKKVLLWRKAIHQEECYSVMHLVLCGPSQNNKWLLMVMCTVCYIKY
jgi:hypothetical protein